MTQGRRGAIDNERSEPKTNDRGEPRPSVEEMERKLKIAVAITRLFVLERYVYLLSCVLSLGVVLYSGWKSMDHGPSNATLVAFCGATGVMSVAIARLLFMWNKVVDLILTEVTQ
jgi:hypothetical protein